MLQTVMKGGSEERKTEITTLFANDGQYPHWLDLESAQQVFFSWQEPGQNLQ